MAAPRVFTLDQLTEHSSKHDCWLVIRGMVVDVTKFLEDHPGGEQVLLELAGKDATKEFEAIGHSKVAEEIVLQNQVGLLQGFSQPHADDLHLKEAADTKEVEKQIMTSGAFVIKDDELALTTKTLGQLVDHLVPLVIVVFALLWYRS